MSLVDITPPPAEDESMDPAAKQYIDSSDAIAEARNDAKLAEFRATIEAYTARAEERDHKRAKDIDRLEAAMISLKRTVITTGIAATLSTVFGVAAFNAALMQNVFAALELGRQATPTQIRMQADMTQIQMDLQEIKRQLADQRAAGGR